MPQIDWSGFLVDYVKSGRPLEYSRFVIFVKNYFKSTMPEADQMVSDMKRKGQVVPRVIEGRELMLCVIPEPVLKKWDGRIPGLRASYEAKFRASGAGPPAASSA